MQLGFVPVPKPRFLFIGKVDGSTNFSSWYMLDNGKQIEPPEQAICGYVKMLALRSKERRGKMKQKLNIGVDCGESKFILESGVETIFSRGFVQGLLSLDSVDEPLTIAVERFEISEGDAVGDDAIACKFYRGASVVKFEWSRDLSVAGGLRAIAIKFPQLEVKIESETLSSTQHQEQLESNGNGASASVQQSPMNRTQLNRLLNQWLRYHQWDANQLQTKLKEFYGKTNIEGLGNEEVSHLIQFLSQLQPVTTEF